MKNLLLLGVIFLSSNTALAHEILPYNYLQFGYAPVKYESGEISEEQRAQLNGCITFAKERQEDLKKSAEAMAAIYGQQSLQHDNFGVYLTNCLTNEKEGKDWEVYEKRDGAWKKVTPRFASRSFMKLDPEQ